MLFIFKSIVLNLLRKCFGTFHTDTHPRNKKNFRVGSLIIKSNKSKDIVFRKCTKLYTGLKQLFYPVMLSVFWNSSIVNTAWLVLSIKQAYWTNLIRISKWKDLMKKKVIYHHDNAYLQLQLRMCIYISLCL